MNIKHILILSPLLMSLATSSVIACTDAYKVELAHKPVNVTSWFSPPISDASMTLPFQWSTSVENVKLAVETKRVSKDKVVIELSRTESKEPAIFQVTATSEVHSTQPTVVQVLDKKTNDFWEVRLIPLCGSRKEE